MKLVIIAILVVLAAIFKAVADTIAHHSGGVMKRKWGKFFDMTVQGKFLPLTKYPLDGWHVANSLMVFCFVAAASLALNTFFPVTFISLGIIFNIFFNTFFNKILK